MRVLHCCEAAQTPASSASGYGGEWAGLSERHETVSMKRLWSGRGLPLRRGGTTGEQTDKTFCFYSILVFRHDCLFVDDEAIKSILFYNLIYD